MFVIPILIYISWQSGNLVWAYVALGLAVLAALVQVSREQQQKKAAADELSNALNNWFRGIKSTQN